MPGALAVATLESVSIVAREDHRRDHLATLIHRFREGVRELPFELVRSSSPIQPLLVGDPARALALSRALEERGLLIGAIRPPTVPEGTSRLRITLTAAHRAADVDRLLESLNELAIRTPPRQANGPGG